MNTCKRTLLCVLAILYAGSSFAQLDSAGLDKVFGKKGTVQGQVYRITFPRSDLSVRVGNFPVSAGLGVTSWVGIINMGDQAMMMGDLALLDTEVGRVVALLVSNHLPLTAMHNHLLNEQPNIKFIHFSGSGNATALAASIMSVLRATGTPMGPAAPSATAGSPDWSKVEAVLGRSGKHNGLLLQYTFPRKEKLTEGGMEMPAPMGMATGINIQMDGERAGITGDFVLLADEVNPVVKALTENGITVTAIHNHMLYDDPRLFMMHFWAVGDPEKLAIGLKAALEQTNSKL
jgi:hypothetical protein